MLALQKCSPGPGHVGLIEIPEPHPAAHEVKLEVAVCGICGTDLHVREDTFRNFPPVTLGHEFAGRVVAEGDAVRGTTDPDAVYAVLGATAGVDRHCPFVRSGDFILSPNRRGMGHGVNGAFTRYVTARPDQLFELPAGVPAEEGPLVEPLAVAVHAVAERSRVVPGDVVLVSGPGPIGLLCVLLLAQTGTRIVVAGTKADSHRLALARKIGAHRTVDVESEDLEAAIRAESGSHGADIAFETAGAAASAAACLRVLRPHGRYVQVGHFGEEITVPFDLVAFRQLAVTGSVGYTEATWRRAIRLLVQGLRPSCIVTHRFPLSDWQQGFELFEKKTAAKVLLYP